MLGYVVRRSASAVAAVLGASVVAFLLLRLVPGSPARLVAGPFASQTAVRHLAQDMGLGQPVYLEYWRYIAQFATGHWGYSYSLGEPVLGIFQQRLPATLEMGLYAAAFAIGGSVVLALAAAYWGGAVDRCVQAITSFGMGVVPFWLGVVVLLVLSQGLGVLPGPQGRLSPGIAPPPMITGLYTVDATLAGEWGTLGNAIWHLIAPAVVLGLFPMGYLTRLLRANLEAVEGSQFLMVARSKGASRGRVLLLHGLPNAAVPTVTASGLVLGQILVGTVLIESVFQWPGVGAVITQSIEQKDYGVVQAFVLLSAVLFVGVNLVVDIFLGVLDPRLRR